MARDRGDRQRENEERRVVSGSRRDSGPAPTVGSADPLLRLHAAAGNRATVNVLRQAQFALEVGAADDPCEREADAVARGVVAVLGSEATPPAAGDGDGPSASSVARRVVRRRRDGADQHTVGADGGPVDAAAEAQLRAARSAGTPLPKPQRARLERAFGGADFGAVRLHAGPAAADLNARFGARAFTVGSDIFFRQAAPDLTNREGSELLAHELAHTVQQAPGARREMVRRDFVGTWDLAYAKLSKDAQDGYTQFVAINGAEKAQRVCAGALEKDGPNKGQYNTARAEAVWKSKKMSDDAFAKAMQDKRARETKDLKGILTTMNHLCNETDGTHRPGSAGDGTSEWALKWEAIFGEPYKSPAGHAIKLQDYCKNLSENLAAVAATKGSVPPAETMQWKENNTAVPVEVNVLAQTALVVTRATTRLGKMKEGLEVWNKRAARFPNSWNADGTTKRTPPGERPEANGKLEAGWPTLNQAKIP